MNPNNTQNQNNYQGQIPNNNIQYQSNNQIPIGQPVQQYQGVQQSQQYQQYQQAQQYQQSQQIPMGQQQGVQIIQDAVQQPRTISPEEVLQAQHPMTQQELQRTQVLNIEEVEKAARYEKISSKKPAIAVAVLGVLFLAFGTTFQVASNLKASHSKIEKRDIAEEVVNKNAVEPAKVIMKCTQAAPNNADGTDTVFTVQYNFEDNKLVGFTKTFEINPTVGNPLGNTTIQSYTRAYQPYMNPTTGYQISVVPNGEGLITTVVVDYKTLDLTLLNSMQQNHFSTSLDYPLDSTAETVQSGMTTQGFICE